MSDASDRNIEEEIRMILAIDNSRLERLNMRICESVSRGATPTVGWIAPRKRIIFALAAGIVIAALAYIAILVFLPGKGPEPKFAGAGGKEEKKVRTVLRFKLTAPGRLESCDLDFGVLHRLVKNCDAAVFGEVISVSENAAEFQVEKVLKGDVAGEPSKIDTGRRYTACEGPLSFKLGEECLLFLEKKGDKLEVLHGASGKHSLPFDGIFTLGEVKKILDGKEFTGAEIRGIIGRIGAGRMHRISYHMPPEIASKHDKIFAEYLGDSGWKVRVSAMHAVFRANRNPEKKIIDKIKALLKDPEIRVRKDVISACILYGYADQDIIRECIEMLKSRTEDESARALALRYIYGLMNQGDKTAAEAEETVRGLLDDPVFADKETALLYLAATKNKAHLNIIAAYLENSEYSRTASIALEKLSGVEFNSVEDARRWWKEQSEGK